MAPPPIKWWRLFIASLPISYLGIFIVVTVGSKYLVRGVLSKPVTAISSGTLKPLSFIALIVPNAIWSFAVTIAVGDFSYESSAAAFLYPLSNVSSPKRAYSLCSKQLFFLIPARYPWYLSSVVIDALGPPIKPIF